MEVFLKIVKIFFIVIMAFCMVVSFLLLSMTVHLILKSFIDVSSSHSHNYIDIFEIKNKQYVLKVIGKNQTNVGSEISGLFSYNIVKNDKNLKIGCGTLLLAGYDVDKKYFFGKSEYGDKIKGAGIYQNGNKIIESKENISEKENNTKFLKEQCTGYFVLDLKTGEYQGGLSEEQQKKILSDKGIENKMEWTREFLDRNGETREDYKGLESWMYILKE